MSRSTFNILASLVLASLSPFVQAGTVQVQLGEQDFADGKTPVYSREIRAAGAGEVFPFDGTIFGNDLKKGGLGSFDYTHLFELNGQRAVAATLRVGLIDIDSTPSAPFDTISLMFNGVEQPSHPFIGISQPGSASSVEVVDIPVPAELLADGKLHVSFAAKRAGYRAVGNAIEPDFSLLTIATVNGTVVPPILDPDYIPGPPPEPAPPVPAVPLPPALIPAGLLLAGFAATPKKRLRRWLAV